MMWMRMPGQTWVGSAASFLLMWLAMMVAMMMPSPLPMFLKTRRSLADSPGFLTLVAAGYFATWLGVGAFIYGLGVAFAATATRWELLSRAVPVLSAVLLFAAGSFQFTRWKMAGLRRCRAPVGCAANCMERKRSFLVGCQQGASCCVCCSAPMMIQLALGVMNPLVMMGAAIVIAAEKLLPRPEMVARVVGVAAMVAGVGSMIWVLF